MCASPTKSMLLSAGAVIEIEQTLEFEPRELDFYFFGAFFSSPCRPVFGDHVCPPCGKCTKIRSSRTTRFSVFLGST